MARNLDLDHLNGVSASEIDVLSGVTPGTAAASKALVLDSSGDILIPDNSNVDFGIGADLRLSSDGTNGTINNENGTDLEIGLTNGASLRLGNSSGTVTVEGVQRTTVGNGVIVTDKCTVVEGGDGVLHKTTFTFTLTGDHDLDLADGADHGTGIKIYEFPAGDLLILGATVNGLVTSVNAEGGGATFPMALGSALASDDATLTGTEADFLPSVAVAGGSAKDWHGRLAATKRFENAGGSNLDLYVNAAITNAVSTAAVTIAVTGVATITWINLGDF